MKGKVFSYAMHIESRKIISYSQFRLLPTYEQQDYELLDDNEYNIIMGARSKEIPSLEDLDNKKTKSGIYENKAKVFHNDLNRSTIHAAYC